MLLTRPEHIYYLVGVEPPHERAVALVASREMACAPSGRTKFRATSRLKSTPSPSFAQRSRPAEKNFGATCARHRRPHGHDSLLVDAEGAPLAFGGVRDGRHVIQELLRQKDDDEVKTITTNLEANDRAFAAVERELRPGTSDYEVMALCLRELSEAAGGPVAYDANIGLGELGGTTEAQPSGAVAREGTIVFIDLYPRRNHYVGDSTRTFAVGFADAWALEAHARLEAALAIGETLLVPGARASDVDSAARTAAAVGGQSYPHHSGHGLGLRAPEPPFIVPGSDDVIRVGDVIALEPGHYVPGVGGMRPRGRLPHH